ncbi:MAG: radical SAM protein, partial [Acidobacteriota bacterium]
MKVVYEAGDDNLAKVYIGRFPGGKYIEFVESVQPPFPKEKKFVLIVSTLFGCPVGCLICDAGRKYNGKLTADEIFGQIDFLVDKNFKNRNIKVDKFKIQFSRMGEPALNNSVLDVLESFNRRYNAPGFIPSISSIAPAGSDDFFKKLKEIKDSLYNKGNFQLQFSIHTTDELLRDKMIPIKKWDFKKIADYG